MNRRKRTIVILIGPPCSGKSFLACRLTGCGDPDKQYVDADELCQKPLYKLRRIHFLVICAINRRDLSRLAPLMNGAKVITIQLTGEAVLKGGWI